MDTSLLSDFSLKKIRIPWIEVDSGTATLSSSSFSPDLYFISLRNEMSVGLLSGRVNIRRGNVLLLLVVGQMSGRVNVRSGYCPGWQMSVGLVSVGEVSVGLLSSVKCPLGKCPRIP